MSFNLLHQQDVQQTFTDIFQIAQILENVTIGKKLSLYAADAQKVREKTSEEVLTIAPVLALSPSCDLETVKKVSNIGRGLAHLANRLQQQIDNYLVEFFAHQRKKESSFLEEIASKRRIIPSGYVSQTQTLGMQFGGASSFPFANYSSPEQDLRDGDSFSTLSASPTSSPSVFTATAENNGRTTRSAHQTTSAGGIDESVTGGSRTAPLARKLKERRDAASTLQSFLFLVLESCIAQCDATCAAIFISGLPLMPKVARQPRLGGVRDTSAKEKPPVADFQPLGCPSSESEVNKAPRFLHCIANLLGEGKFPNEVSWAITNPLTTVVQSGVALNLRNTEAPYLPNIAELPQPSERRGDPATETINKSARKLLNINNGLILPLRDFGCVVLANKKSLDGVRSFTLSDEHILWGASLVIGTVLSRYQKDLLVDNAWFPSHIPCLQRFLTVPTIGESRGLRVSNLSHRDAFSGRVYRASELETALTNSFGSLATGVLKFISEARAVSMPLRQTIVRTADPSLIHALPGDLIGPRSSTASVEQVTEEEIFQGAAEYITNLESLWHKTLRDNNAAHVLVNHYNKEIEARNEEIRLLEKKIRNLNIKIVQLERQKQHS